MNQAQDFVGGPAHELRGGVQGDDDGGGVVDREDDDDRHRRGKLDAASTHSGAASAFTGTESFLPFPT